jgi:hypothetical protein
MWTRRLRIFYCFLACTIGLYFLNGCSKPYGLADIDSAGYGKIVVFENVRFSELLKATYEVLDWAGLEVAEEIEQPKFNALTIIARNGKVDTMKLQIKSLSETVHELKLFTPSERGTSKEKSFSHNFYKEVEKRLSNNSNKIK